MEEVERDVLAPLYSHTSAIDLLRDRLVDRQDLYEQYTKRNMKCTKNQKIMIKMMKQNQQKKKPFTSKQLAMKRAYEEETAQMLSLQHQYQQIANEIMNEFSEMNNHR